jgi:uncharacterized membrane protein
MEVWVAQTLRVGVAVASVVILLGVVLSLAGGRPTGAGEVLGEPSSRGLRPSPSVLLQGLARGEPASVLQLGLLLLILTPVVRVAMTMALFAAQGDWTFVLITGWVLALLVLGLVGVSH